MKKIAVVLVVLAALTLTGCGGLFLPNVTEEEAVEAFMVSMMAVTVAYSEYVESGSVDGVEFENDAEDITFDDYDISDSEYNTTEYTEISGTMSGSANGMTADLKLQGGPVKTLEYSIEEGDTSITITANGDDFEYAYGY